MSAERWVWTNVPDVNWKRVPGARSSSNCERTVSEACPCPPHHEVVACWWSETAVTAATANIGQINRRCAVKDIKNENASRVWQPERIMHCGTPFVSTNCHFQDCNALLVIYHVSSATASVQTFTSTSVPTYSQPWRSCTRTHRPTVPWTCI